MQYSQNESGRSMVEMLGVLAVIGVLSIGGIVGFSTAMNKHRANEIVYSVSAGNMGLQTGQFPDFFPVTGATFKATGNYNGKPIFIEVDIEDEKVCQMVKELASPSYYIEGNCE